MNKKTELTKQALAKFLELTLSALALAESAHTKVKGLYEKHLKAESQSIFSK